MTAATYTRPNYAAQSGSQYPANIDGASRVFERIAAAFAPHEQAAGSPAPDLTVVVDAGALWDGSSLIEVTQQTVSGFTIPSAGTTRIDRVVMDPSDGQVTRVAGAAVASSGSPGPAKPAIPAGKVPVCSVTLTSSNTAITNDLIEDERVPVVSYLPQNEVGDWTPIISDGTNNATMAGSTAASYVKNGPVIDIVATVGTTSLGSVSGAIRVTGLPFVGKAGRIAPIAVGSASGLAITAGHNMSARIDGGNSYISLFMWDATTGTTSMDATEWSADGAATFGGTYLTN